MRMIHPLAHARILRPKSTKRERGEIGRLREGGRSVLCTNSYLGIRMAVFSQAGGVKLEGICPRLPENGLRPADRRRRTARKHPDHENPPSYATHRTPFPMAPNPNVSMVQFDRNMLATHLG